MTKWQDEVLRVVPGDSSVKPRYNLIDQNSAVVATNVELKLVNAIEREGTPVNASNLNSLETRVDAAQSTADNGVSRANEAQSTANTAVTSAGNAMTRANQGVTNAAAANGVATAALEKANAAAPKNHAATDTQYGAASGSNYGHAKASSTAPKAHGTAGVGAETTTFARGDHVHPAQTEITGNAGSATKLQNQRKINETVFDGSMDIKFGRFFAAGVTQFTNLNDYRDEGFYYCSANATAGSLLNCPTSNAFGMIVQRHAGVHQRIVEYMPSGAPKEYFRNFYGDTWLPWVREYTTVDKPTTSDIGAVAKSGDTMTGLLTLPSNPTSNLHAATKQYVDAVETKANAAQSTANAASSTANAALPKAGGTMTGSLTLSGAPTANNHAATKQYVDAVETKANSAQTTANAALPKAGGTITGNLAVSGSLTVGGDAVRTAASFGEARVLFGTVSGDGENKVIPISSISEQTPSSFISLSSDTNAVVIKTTGVYIISGNIQVNAPYAYDGASNVLVSLRSGESAICSYRGPAGKYTYTPYYVGTIQSGVWISVLVRQLHASSNTGYTAGSISSNMGNGYLNIVRIM